MKIRKKLFLSLLLAGLVTLAACSDFGYYLQCARGHLQVIHNSSPIEQLLLAPETGPETREKLLKVQQIREFATAELGLPDNDSYRNYADIGRPYVLWNLVAAEEFSLTPKKWCFPVAGCVSYKGYFNRQEAEGHARKLQQQGYDVDVYGVQAYSTLNWFADPVLNTFLNSSESRLAGLIFHELAHQVLYIPDDSRFNEAFAQTVQFEGVRRWFKHRATPEQWQLYLAGKAQSAVFHEYLRTTRQELQELYSQNLPADQLKQQKKQIFDKAMDKFEDLKREGTIDGRFDRWMSRGLNNARLAAVATYRDLIPLFEALLQNCDGDLNRFYAEVRRISNFPPDQRIGLLNSEPPPSLSLSSPKYRYLNPKINDQ